MLDPLETYLRELCEIRASGAAQQEPSFYPALSDLLNAVGKQLKPRVRCIMNLKNQGAGLPDGGLFTADQIRPDAAADAVLGLIPARGVVEVKPTSDDAWVTAAGEQVSRYWGKYRQVLVTNYRDFVLLGQDAEGQLTKLETYRLAPSESAFWAATATPHRTARADGGRFMEYLKRVLLHAAPLAAPQDVAWFLASYARDARARLDGAELPALAAIRAALEEALGLRFEGPKGEHFFRSTLVQTLFYGVFAAWVLWSKQHAPTDRQARFNWHEAQWSLRVPMIRALFEQVAAPSKLKPLGLEEVLDWTAATLNRVDRASFFATFEEGRAIQYFYEPFLKAFDPELRKELGIWYTPPEVVKYMVARVDTVLRRELGIEDGLADPRVYVLDPCCGTGAYLVEALRRIATTLREKGADALWAYDLKRAAMERIFVFEILPAPFVVAHLQLGLLLQTLGAPLADAKNERAAVYLTNALTGWEPPEGPKQHLLFPEMEEERDAAEAVKRDRPILVVLGNPPYNAFAGVSPQEERGLVEPYKVGLISEWGIKKFNLDELYVRFFRLAERRIAEQTGKGVVCYISNHSWVSDPSFVVLRRRLLASFDRFWIENMHGNRKISEYAPDGTTSETIFAIPGFSAGIQQGVAISLWVKTGETPQRARVLFRDDLDAGKAVERRTQLLASLEAKDFDAHYEPANPNKTNRFSFRPSDVAAHYLAWPKLVELCAKAPSNGLMEKRAGALIDIDRAALERRMRMYYDSTVDWDTLRALGSGLTKDAALFEAKKARDKVRAQEAYEPTRVRPYALRPFETRWCYYSPAPPLWNRPRPDLWAQCWEGNAFVSSRPAGVADPEGVPISYTTVVGDNDALRGHAYYFPLRLRGAPARKAEAQADFLATATPTANLSAAARAYLRSMGITDPDADAATAASLWMHTLAIGYSPAYLVENADGIRQDWPRIPLPDSRDVLLASAALGRQVAALLDSETPVAGVTVGSIRPELLRIAVITTHAEGGRLDPDAGDLALTAGWGHAGKGGVTMPGKGRLVERAYTAEEHAAVAAGATALGLSTETALAHLGETTCDVYLNSRAYWRNIPIKVWRYTIGGYQVIKKWLSYREQELLGRALTADEAREVTAIARRIAALMLLEPQLDASYRAAVRSTYGWPAAGSGASPDAI